MKKKLSRFGLIISSVMMFLIVLLDIKQFLSLGYVIESNSIIGNVVLIVHIITLLFILLFLLAVKKNKIS